DEGARRRERGEDVVYVATQPEEDRDIARIISALPIIPTRNDGGVPVIDVPAVLARRPHVCLVDGLAYRNPPGSRHRNRYEDVEELLASGISVMTSINLEYIAEQQEFVRGVIGRTSPETVPQALIDRAEEVGIVDPPPLEGDMAIEDQRPTQPRHPAVPPD